MQDFMNKLFTFRSNLEKSLKGFETDPADTDYQEGYRAALADTREDLITTFEGVRE